MSVARARSFILCAVLSLAAACGGGGDSSSANYMPTPTPTPAVVAPSALTYTSPTTATLGTALTLSPVVSGNPTTWAVAPALPAGLTIDATSGAITGTPTVLADAATYTVTATNSAGNTTFALSLKVASPAPSPYTQTNLVSNGAVAGTKVDARLVNPWGIAFGATSPVWVANAGSQTSTLYDGTGTALATVVAIPPGNNGASDPTGIVANATSEFVVGKAGVTGAARFIFASESGTISGWAPTVDAANAITTYDDGAGGASYTGLAYALNGAVNTLYAADFKHGKIDVFNGTWQKIAATGGFTDPQLPAGYANFNVQAVKLGQTTYLVVTYALRNAGGDETVGAGLGVVDLFDLNGTLVRRLVGTGGKLNAPWGVALATGSFGSLSNMLLIGNFGDGTINAYDPTSGVYAGTVANSQGTPLANVGLWGIAFGNGSQNQPANTLYFAAGISGETAGLYGRIDPGASAPDAVAPTVSLTAPAAGTISGKVTLTATANDDVGVAKVNFIIRVGTTNTTLGTDTTAPYTFDLDTTAFPNGAATLTAQAVDAAGNATTSSAVAVTINNVATMTLATLQANLFGPVCSGCHSGGGASLPSSMNFTSQAATAAALVNVTSLEVGSLKRVLPGDPANSYVVQKISGTAAVGGRMPLGGAALSQQQIDDVKAWIQAGAAP